MMGVLKYAERQDFATARSLFATGSWPRYRTWCSVAKELQALHSTFKGNIDLLSDDPNGTVEAGLPPGEVRAGVFTVGGTTTDVILVRVDDPKFGKIWLISKETVARIPELYAQMESEGPTAVERIVPAALTQSSSARDVTGAMARVAALDPDLMVAGLAVGVSAECAPASLVQTPKTSFQNGLGDATWHAAPMHHCDLDAWLFRLPA